jgi:lipoprotein-anchoring transpeptidase ErfK/SrfK
VSRLRLVTASVVALAAALPATAAAGTRQAPPPAPAAPAPAAMVTGLDKLTARSGVAFTGERFVLSGALHPYVAGQVATVEILRNGKRIRLIRAVPLKPGPDGSGHFRLKLRSVKPGRIAVRAGHVATPQQAQVSAKTLRLQAIRPHASSGDRGPSVRYVQRTLSKLHYAVSHTGVYDTATSLAVIAFEKMTGKARDGVADHAVFTSLRHGGGRFRVKYPRDGRHVEASLGKQVLALINPGGRVLRIYTTSSGKPSTPTVLGRFHVYQKSPGTNSEGMFMSNYFIRGYAIHGYPDVPVFAASHGCLRIPNSDAVAVFNWIRIGTIVDVYPG